MSIRLDRWISRTIRIGDLAKYLLNLESNNRGQVSHDDVPDTRPAQKMAGSARDFRSCISRRSFISLITHCTHNLTIPSARIDVCSQHLVRESWSQSGCFAWLAALECRHSKSSGERQRCKSSCAVSNSSLSSYLLWLPRRLAYRRQYSGSMFVPWSFSSLASSKFSGNCGRNMESTRSCWLADCFLRFPWPFLVPSISPSRRVLRPSCHAGFPRIRFGSIWWASLFFARRSVLPFSSRHGWQRLWSE